MSAASHQQIFKQLCIGMVPCKDFKKAFLIQWFSFLPEELTSVQDEYYCTLLIKKSLNYAYHKRDGHIFKANFLDFSISMRMW